MIFSTPGAVGMDGKELGFGYGMDGFDTEIIYGTVSEGLYLGIYICSWIV